MPDGSDPGRVERYTDRQDERVRQTVHEPNRSDILKTIRKGRRGNIPSPKPNQRTKPSWSKATVRNNARDLRILAGQLQGLKGHTPYAKFRDTFSPSVTPNPLEGAFDSTISIQRRWALIGVTHLFYPSDLRVVPGVSVPTIERVLVWLGVER